MVKSLIRNVDSFLFGGAVRRLYRRRPSEEDLLSDLKTGLGYSFNVHYAPNQYALLSQLCEQYGSDKGAISKSGHPYAWPPQTFADFYSRLFDHCRFAVRNVFECGIGTNDPTLVSSMGVSGRPGASLRVWRDYFPNAEIVGADIDDKILFSDRRISTFHVDQTDPRAISELWHKAGVAEFDLMVDDGLHTYEAGICLFENSISRLAKCGIYSIEDVTVPDVLKFKKYFSGTQKFQVDYVNLFRPNLIIGDNNLVVIRHMQV